MSTALPLITPKHADIDTALGTLRVAHINLAGTPRGAVILLYGSEGFDDQSVELMNGFAEHGYESLAADVTSIGQPDHDHNEDRALATLGTLVSYLGDQGWSPEQIGVVGYRFGGRVALRAAAALQLGAAVSVSPDGLSGASTSQPDVAHDARPVTTPWLGLFGDDEEAPDDNIESLAQRLTSPSPAYTQFVKYPGVGSYFFNESVEVLGRAAKFDSWQRVVEWLNLRVVPRATPLAEIWSLNKALTN